MLTLEPKAFLRDGLTYGENRRAFLFDVIGLREGQRIQIAEKRRRWQIRRATDGGDYGGWSGRFGTAEEALASLG